jgi:carbon monoxide dehydrogenase subunit G
MNLKSPKTTVNKSAEVLFDYMDNLQNFKHLMPPTVEKFEVDGDSFVFGIKGMPEIRLIVKEKTPFTKYVLTAASSKLDFSLINNIKPIDENSCEVEIEFEADLNPMMAMMLKKPLSNFLNGLSEQLGKI